MIKSRDMRWAGRVTRMGEMRNAHIILVRKLKGKRPLGDLDVDGKTILEWILGKYSEKVCIGLIWLRIWTIGRIL
jgi:hypothetical protein